MCHGPRYGLHSRPRQSPVTDMLLQSGLDDRLRFKLLTILEIERVVLVLDDFEQNLDGRRQFLDPMWRST